MELKKVIIAPDSFKGALTSVQAAAIIAEEVRAAYPDCTIVQMPIADGGEGSVETVLAAVGGEKYEAQVISPDDRLITAGYAIASNETAFLEMAQSSGVTRQNGLHPMTSSTYGFGQLILAALERGVNEFVLCIGGSATTDGGCGMAAALGVRFYDENGDSFIPCGGTLKRITRIDMSGMDGRIGTGNSEKNSERNSESNDVRIGGRLGGSKFSVMCDVDNPLFGETGAAYIYGPQKGASPEQVKELDEGLRHLGKLLASVTGGGDISGVPGAGAAGGLGAGCMAFLDAKLMSGIDAILELCGFREQLSGADLVITGEGKLDAQSFSGKVLSGIKREAGDVPVWSFCGVCDCDPELLREYNIRAFETSEGISIEESMANPEKYLRIAARRQLADNNF